MPNLSLVPKRDLSSFRRIAIGTWRTTHDPSVYGSMALRMDEALRYLEAFRAKTGRRLTLTHMMARATTGPEQAPSACKPRPTISRSIERNMLGKTIMRTVVRTKIVRPPSNTGRRPNRSDSGP